MKYTYTVRGVNKDGVLSPGYNKTGVSAVLSKRKALTQHGEQRRITEKAPSGTAGGGFLVAGYKSDLRLDRGGGQNKKRGAYEPALLIPCHGYTEGSANRRRVFSRNGLRKRLLYAIVYLLHHRPNAPSQC